jgi:gamma-glutamyltranspeptidase/glutathione hydrolase
MIRNFLTRSLLRLLAASLLLAPVVSGASTPEPVRGQNGAVASRSMIASQVGVDIMRAGGNAIDAAVATGFALAVTWPSAGNLGGGGFMVIHLADGTVITNDHRETAPAGASETMYQDEDGSIIEGLSTHSHLAVGVPGSVAGMLDALERYGTMDRREVIAPAIRLARDGFPLSYDHARNFRRALPRMAPYPASMAQFTRDGEPYAEGEVFRQPDLARTLQRVAELGKPGFYEGETADLIVAEMERGGGIITHEDLASYESVWREPIHGTYRGHEIWSMPPPSSGGLLLVQMLNMLEPHEVGAMGYGSAAATHLMIEAERRAYADRAEHLGDSDFYPVPFDMLVDPAYARHRMADFDPAKATPSDAVGAGSWPVESPDTTHLSTMDAAGNAVAYTTTLNLSYGTKIVVTGAGFLLNNEMDDFSSKPGFANAYGLLGDEANAIAPGKRMLSSMTPTIVTKDGEPWLVAGSPGGSTIITTTFQVVVNSIDHGMRINDAVGRPRFHHQWQPERVVYEPLGLSPDTLSILEGMGHDMVPTPWGGGIGDANSIKRADGEIRAMGDPRNAGGAAAF